MGAQILNRRPAVNPLRQMELFPFEAPYSISDLLEPWRAGVKRGEELYRTTGMSPARLSSSAADGAFATWWEYGGSADSPLPRAIARTEWLRGFRKGRENPAHDPNESVQDRSYREWRENFQRVSASPETASVNELERAINYLSHARGRIQRAAWDQGKKADADVIAGYDAEEQYYARLIREKRGRQ